MKKNSFIEKIIYKKDNEGNLYRVDEKDELNKLDKLDINMCGAFKGSYNAVLEYKIECENYTLKKE